MDEAHGIRIISAIDLNWHKVDAFAFGICLAKMATFKSDEELKVFKINTT